MADPQTVISEQTAAPIDPGTEIMPRKPLMVVDGFLPMELATAMREDIDRHFAERRANSPKSHQV
ncbi:MAG TPA: hypothetical protein VN808_13405, partial [Stellaceae bacterium]|nr:hypothetical protein [Stellaceae bacterium]